MAPRAVRRAASALVVAMLAITVVAPAAPAAPAPTPEAPTPDAPTPASTPVFSLRRVPQLLARSATDSRLGAQLDAVLADPALGGARESSCLSVQDPSGRTSYARRPDASLIPASTMKVATATVVLESLGPATRLTTEVRSVGRSPEGVVGDLWLVGGGDPLLSTAGFAVDGGFGGQPRLATSMEALADSVVAAGVRRVTGRVIGDESRFDAQRVVPTWNPRYQATFEVSPLSALIVDKGFISRAPALPMFTSSPAAHAAAVLATLLSERGVVIDGGSGEGKAAAEASVVGVVASPPMVELVGQVLQHSDNLGAEMLVKELGVRFGAAGTTAEGLAVIKSRLTTLGIDLDGVAAADGSGLDRSDRLTCTALQGVLDRAGEGRELDQGLPVAGRNGTLHRRFIGTPAAGKVRAKTGGLDGVVALAGWVSAPSGGSAQFSLLLNDLPRSSPGTAAQDKVVSVLATYPAGPNLADIGPRVFAPPAASG